MKKISTLVTIFSLSATCIMAQADTAANAANWKGTPNPGFEGWNTTGTPSYSNPNGWNSANSQSAITGTFGCVKATGANAKVGSAAVELITESILGITAPGIVTTGTVPTSASGSITGGIAYTLRPDSIVGWFKYAPQGADNGFAAMYLFGSAANNTDTVAEASFSTGNVTTSTYKRFAAAFVYRNTDAVANSIWLLSSSSGTSGAVVGSSAYFDELAVIIKNTTGIANQTNPGASIVVSPNPATDHFMVTTVGSNSTISLFDITGRKVTEQKLLNGPNLVDVNLLTNGVYIYTVADANGLPLKTGKIIIQK